MVAVKALNEGETLPEPDEFGSYSLEQKIECLMRQIEGLRVAFEGFADDRPDVAERAISEADILADILLEYDGMRGPKQ
jgi:hypothetical protein